MNDSHSQTRGLPPGTLRPPANAVVPESFHVIRYSADVIEERNVASLSEIADWRDTQDVLWVNVDGLGNVDLPNPITIASGPLPWVAASGAEDITVLKVQLAPKSTTLRKYTVRLIFAERHLDVTAGGRVFDVSLQDKVVREKFDIVKAAGGPRRSVALVYRDVPVMTELVVGLRPVQGRPILCGVELISER